MKRILWISDIHGQSEAYGGLFPSQAQVISSDEKAGMGQVDLTINLVVLESNLPPAESGWQVNFYREVFQTRPNLPVVVIAGGATDGYRPRLLELGFAAVLHKPMDVSKVKEIILRLLEVTDEDKQPPVHNLD